jgi:hypothetical protein
LKHCLIAALQNLIDEALGKSPASSYPERGQLSLLGIFPDTHLVEP